MSLETVAKLSLTATLTKAVDLITAGLSAPLQVNLTQTLHDGFAAGQADRIYWKSRTLALSTSEDLDLAGNATFLDPFGVAITFVKIKGLYFFAYAANTNTLIVGNGTNPFIGPFGAAGASEQRIPPSGFYCATHPTTGWTVTAATGDIIKVLNGGAGTPVTYDVVIWGTSA